MKQNNKFFAIFLVLVALLVLVSACGGANKPAPTPTEEVAVPTVTDTPITDSEAEPTEMAPATAEPVEETDEETDETADETESASTDDAYPEPDASNAVASPKDYPEPANAPEKPNEETEDDANPDDYPAASEVETEADALSIGPDFNIDEPVLPGVTTVTGDGPKGVPIRLINVSELGIRIGETVIDEDGTFVFELEEPLGDQISIGIQIGDFRDVDNPDGWTYDDFLVSPNYYHRAFVGILLDLVSTSQ